MLRVRCTTKPFVLVTLATVIVLVIGDGQAWSFTDADLEFFERQVRPLLVARCYECHGPETDELKGGLRIDSRAAILTGGETGPAIVPGDPNSSLLIDAINYGNVVQMPPKSKLPDHEIAILTKWVKMGAPWPQTAAPGQADPKRAFNLQERREEHWCWQPVRANDPPEVRNADWPKRPLDFFILTRLEAVDLEPAETADRRTLIRRASFDLIGLPPSPEEVEAFLHDDSPEAFEKVVDQLLESEHFGERWARHWMDLVRYAETYGHEHDFELPYASQYRDYLIRAFNQDVPYNQFVIEHIAGDLLENPRRHPTEDYNESIIGTGFWWLGEAAGSPVDVVDDEAVRVDNQLDVMSKTFLGLTVACARCHNHKFDAISTKDYYALSGYLKSSRRVEAFIDPGGEVRQATDRLQAIRGRGDELLRQSLPPPNDDLKQMMARYLLASQDAMFTTPTAEVKDDLDPDRLSRWVAALKEEATEQATHPLHPWLAMARHRGPLQPQQLDQQRRHLVERAAKDATRDEQTPVFEKFDGEDFGDWFVNGEAFGKGPTRAGQWDSRQRGTMPARPGIAHSGMLADRHQGVLRSRDFTITHPHIMYRVAGTGGQIRLIMDSHFMVVHSDLLFVEFQLKVDTEGAWTWRQQAGDIGRYLGHRAHLEIIDHGDGWVAVDEIRLAGSDLPAAEDNPLARRVFDKPDLSSINDLAEAYADLIAESLARWRNSNADARETDLVRWLMKHELVDVDPDVRDQLADLATQLSDESSPMPHPVRVLAMADGTGQNQHVYIRGNHHTPGEVAPRQSLVAFAGDNQPVVKNGSGRLAFAHQLVNPSNPLTARVMVNRLWHHLFGRGIVASVDNFGVLGQRPTHPELLDHLANQFVRGNWSVKRMLREICTSSTYQMSSLPTEKGSSVDPQNLLLHRIRIRRLQGEVIRDAMLVISGRLNQTQFGKSVPVHLTEFMRGRGRPENSGPMDGDGRRSVYIQVQRNFMVPMMLAFDAPQPFNSIGRRNVSNVPAQALIMMNDPFVVEQAGVWAKRLLADKSRSTEKRIYNMYVAGIGRPPSDAEMADTLDFLGQQSRALGLSEDEGRSDERIWKDLCHVLMNVKSFIFVY